jgi:hypothetical protein
LRDAFRGAHVLSFPDDEQARRQAGGNESGTKVPHSKRVTASAVPTQVWSA